MAKPITTDTQIRALKSEIKQYTRTIQSPKLTKGTLLLLVNPGGKKSFKTRYRYDGKQKGFSIGTYPNTSLAKAIEKHNEAMEKLDDGVDPKVYFNHKLADLRTKIDMDNLFIKWHLIKQADKNISPNTIKNHKWRWDKYLSPEIGSLHVDAIQRQHITMALEKVRKPSREEARKSLSTLNMMFNYALSSGFIADNPCLGIRANHLGISASKPRERWLNFDEILKLWTYLDNSETKTSKQTKIAIKIAILTAARRSEIANMEWSEIDLKNQKWTIPAHRSKNKNEHVIHLSDLATSLIEELKILSGQDKFVFLSPVSTNTKALPLSRDGLSRAVARISEKVDIDSFTFHDLRRSAATNWAEKLRASSDVIELMLNHKPQNKLVATYQRSTRSNEQKKTWIKWGQLIQKKI